jgi:5'-nucleotidase
VKITILSINDFHGQLDPLQIETRERVPRLVRVGGAVALAATIEELRAQNPTGTVLLDGGDFMQGSLLSNWFEGRPIGEFYSLLGLDAAAVGNHEFDFGPVGPERTAAQAGDDPQGALKAFARGVPFPLLSANLQLSSGEHPGWLNIERTTMLVRRGVRIGVIGLTTVETPITSWPSNVTGLRFAPLVAAVRTHSAKLRRSGADVVIVLAHEGGHCAARSPTSCTGAIFKLLDQLEPGLIDGIVAGHTHQCLWHKYKGVPIIEACSRGVAVGRMELHVWPGRGVERKRTRVLPPRTVCHDVFSDSGDCEAGRRTGLARGTLKENEIIRTHTALLDRVRALVAGARERLRSREERILASVARDLSHDHQSLSPMGTLFARFLRHATVGPDGRRADAAIMNAGGIRGEVPAGNWRYAQLFQVFPFDNQLAYADLRPAEIEALLRAILRRPTAGVPQVSGLTLGLRCDGRCRRLAWLRDEHGRSLDPTRRYRIALSDFLLAGGDGTGAVLQQVPPAHKRILTGRLIREEFASYLQALGTVNTKKNPAVPARFPITVEGRCEQRQPASQYICR